MGPRPSCHQLPATEGQPEYDAVTRGAQVAPRQLLHAPDPVAQRMPVAVQPPRGSLPLAVLLYERFKRTHQFTSVVSLAGLYGSEDRVTEQPQCLVLLQRQQQLEGTEVLVGGHPHGGWG